MTLWAAALAALLVIAGTWASGPRAAIAEETAETLEASTVRADDWKADLEPVRNTTTAKLAVPEAGTLVEDGLADTVRVHATMSYGGELTRDVTREASLAELASGPETIDLGDFGKFEVTVSFLLDRQEVHKCDPVTVGVTADSYTIAPVSATLPATFFSLNLWGENSIRADGPVIIMMERPNAYDWENLPQATEGLYGVYALPYVPKDEISYQPSDFDVASNLFRERVDAMAAYVRDLVELDPTSTFDLYCVDFYAGIVQRVIYANRIPEDSYTITLMSDGSWTYKKFAEYYAGADPAATDAQLVSAWNEAKAYAYEHGEVRSDFLDWSTANRCFWALVEAEPNAELWVARKDLLVTPDDANAFGQAVQASEKVVQVNIASLLSENIQPSAEATAEFKALYNFNDSYFSEAEANGKQVMLFLGTRVTNEDGFSDYARFAMSYYGDDYQYYYKGHPGTPSEFYPAKLEELERLGITDVDSSVAAELILFFNPEIFLSGYGSSTYASVPEGMAKGMFGMTKAEGLASPEYQNMDYWSFRVGDATPEALRALCPEGHTCYLVEFSDAVAAEKGYDVAIWDASASLITYYRAAGESYEKVATQDGMTANGDYGCDGGEFCPTHGFSDVDQTQWYHDAVDWAVENDVLKGYGDGGELLGPLSSVTRAEMAQMLWNRAGRPGAEADLSGFSDVDAESGWYADALEWCVSKGIFVGYGDSFGTERMISREEVATVLWRVAGSPETEADLSEFGDASAVSEYAADAIAWATGSGIIEGKDEGATLDPQGWCTRAEVATMLMRMTE